MEFGGRLKQVLQGTKYLTQRSGYCLEVFLPSGQTTHLPSGKNTTWSRATKMAVQFTSSYKMNSVASKRGCSTQKAHFNSTFHSDEASFSPISYCMKKPKRTPTHMHTPNYCTCNPTVHATRVRDLGMCPIKMASPILVVSTFAADLL